MEYPIILIQENLSLVVCTDPLNAMSDANTVLDFKYLEVVLSQAKAMHEMRQELRAKWGEDNVHPE